MQIKSLTLKNFRGFKDTEITFSEGLTVLVGVNGAGKSSVLDALAMMMSQVSSQWEDSVERINIAESDLHADCDFASLGTVVERLSSLYTWEINRSGGRDGRKSEPPNDLNALSLLVRQTLTRRNEPISGPALIYYPAIRMVLDVPIPPPPDAGLFKPIEAYVGCLSARAENFHDFFKWFRAREDFENERIREEGRAAAPDFQLTAIREALKGFLPNFSNPLVRRFLDTIIVEKNGMPLRLDRLSDGEKLLLAIVGDIARRMAMLNPGLENPLLGEGVVLIDEIEQHLHPAWQRTILGNLRRTLPNVQFIVSTHSPQVLGEVPREQIRVLSTSEDGFPVISTPYRSRGLDSNQVLKEIFEAPDRNEEIQKQLDDIFFELDKEDSKALSRARRKIDKLKKELRGEIPELIEAESMLFMLKSL